MTRYAVALLLLVVSTVPAGAVSPVTRELVGRGPSAPWWAGVVVLLVYLGGSYLVYIALGWWLDVDGEEPVAPEPRASQPPQPAIVYDPSKWTGRH